MSSELDSVFVKALKLLHSKAKDSTDHLKQMLDDVLKQCTGFEAKQDILDLSAFAVPAKRMKVDNSVSESRVAKEKYVENHQRDQEKQRDKLWNDIMKDHVIDKATSLVPVVKEVGSSKDKVFDIKDKSTLQTNPSSVTNTGSQWNSKEQVHLKGSAGDSESDEEPEVDADNFAMDLGIACIACKQFDVTPGNQLVECQECHNLYHQDCHRPPVLDSEVNDPRSVWYCSRCRRTLKKLVTKPQTKALKTASPVGKEATVTKITKPEQVSVQPFKRVEPIKPSSTTITNTRPLMGLASLAANLSGKQAVSTKQETIKPTKVESHKPLKTDVRPSGAVSLLNTESVKTGSSHRVDNQPPQSRSALLHSAADGSRSMPSSTTMNIKVPSKLTSTQKAALPVSADKRLQLMKKKAAAKQQDKRMLHR